MEAKSLQTVSSTMTVVRDSTEIRAALTNELEISGKRVLVCKGHDNIAKNVEFVYRAFADHTDLSGEPFLLSRTTHKGLCHRRLIQNTGRRSLEIRWVVCPELQNPKRDRS